MLDYAVEVEHYDRHLGRITRYLGPKRLGGEHDRGGHLRSWHALPRCKGQAYDYSNQCSLPSAGRRNLRKPEESRRSRSFADFAPTFRSGPGRPPQYAMQPLPGEASSICSNYPSPVRSIRRGTFSLSVRKGTTSAAPQPRIPFGESQVEILYLRNFENERWPVGNPETGYLNCDASPIKTLILNQRRNGEDEYWRMNFGKRPANEMYDLRNDPYCVNNLACMEKYQELERRLRVQLFTELEKQRDPRVNDRGFIFDKYPFVGDWNNSTKGTQRQENTPYRLGKSNDYEKKSP